MLGGLGRLIQHLGNLIPAGKSVNSKVKLVVLFEYFKRFSPMDVAPLQAKTDNDIIKGLQINICTRNGGLLQYCCNLSSLDESLSNVTTNLMITSNMME